MYKIYQIVFDDPVGDVVETLSLYDHQIKNNGVDRIAKTHGDSHIREMQELKLKLSIYNSLFCRGCLFSLNPNIWVPSHFQQYTHVATVITDNMHEINEILFFGRTSGIVDILEEDYYPLLVPGTIVECLNTKQFYMVLSLGFELIDICSNELKRANLVIANSLLTDAEDIVNNIKSGDFDNKQQLINMRKAIDELMETYF